MKRFIVFALLILLGCSMNPNCITGVPPAAQRVVYTGIAAFSPYIVYVPEIDVVDMPSVQVFVTLNGMPANYLVPLPQDDSRFYVCQNKVYIVNCENLEYRIVVVK